MSDLASLQQQVFDLQTQVAYQDDTIDGLSQQIAYLQEQLETVRAQVVYLNKGLKQVSESGGGDIAATTIERPPHY